MPSMMLFVHVRAAPFLPSAPPHVVPTESAPFVPLYVSHSSKRKLRRTGLTWGAWMRSSLLTLLRTVPTVVRGDRRRPYFPPAACRRLPVARCGEGRRG